MGAGMSRKLAYSSWFLVLASFVAADAAILLSSRALSRIAKQEVRSILGDRVEYTDLVFTLSEGLDIRGLGLYVTGDRHKVLSAERVHVTFRKDWSAKEVEIENARFSFSDRLVDSLQAAGPAGDITKELQPGQLPRISVRGGALEISHAAVLAWDRPQLLEIEEIVMIPVDGYRYFVGGRVRGSLFGSWRISGEFDLASGAHDLS